MTDSNLLAFVVEHQDEFDAHLLTMAELCSDLAKGEIVLEREESGAGFAVVGRPMTSRPELRYLWIWPEHRRAGTGKRFVLSLKRKYAGGDFKMQVSCYGPTRARFFGRCGFKITGREGELRYMEQR